MVKNSSKCGRSVEEVNGKTYCTTVCLVGKGYVPMTGVKNTGEITQYAENDYINGCVSCDNPNDYPIVSSAHEVIKNCQACGHSTYRNPLYPPTDMCGPMTCASGEFKYFYGSDGSGRMAAQCISCADSAPRYIGNISKFKTMCEAADCGRKVAGKYCVPICGKDKWQDSDGNCYTCDKGNGKGNIIGMDSTSKKLCMDCNRTVVTDDEGNTICQ